MKIKLKDDKKKKTECIIREDEDNKRPSFFLNTGSRVLNLALSGDAWNGGWAGQRIINIIGDSKLGKTLLACEATNQLYYNWHLNRNKNVKCTYNEPEVAFDFELARKFGMPIEWIDWQCSRTVEEFSIDTYMNLELANEYDLHLMILDSLDTLQDSEMQARFKKLVSGKDVKGTYGAKKAKETKAMLNQLGVRIKEKNALLIIISQVIDAIDNLSYVKRLTRAGGHGLDHNSSQIVWLRQIGNIYKSLTLGKGTKQIPIGKRVEILVSKNRLYREGVTVTVDILDRHGVDDLGTTLNWLEEWGFIKKKSAKSQTYNLLEEEGTKRYLIKKMEDDEEFYTNVTNYLQDCWNEVEAKLKPDRKPKYGVEL